VDDTDSLSFGVIPPDEGPELPREVLGPLGDPEDDIEPVEPGDDSEAGKDDPVEEGETP